MLIMSADEKDDDTPLSILLEYVGQPDSNSKFVKRDTAINTLLSRQYC